MTRGSFTGLNTGAVLFGFEKVLGDAYVVVVNAAGSTFPLAELKTRSDLSTPTYSTCTFPTSVTNSAIFIA